MSFSKPQRAGACLIDGGAPEYRTRGSEGESIFGLEFGLLLFGKCAGFRLVGRVFEPKRRWRQVGRFDFEWP